MTKSLFALMLIVAALALTGCGGSKAEDAATKIPGPSAGAQPAAGQAAAIPGGPSAPGAPRPGATP